MHSGCNRAQGLLDQPSADPLLLTFRINGEVGKIRHVSKVGQRSSNPHQPTITPGRHEKIRVFDHCFKHIWTIDGSSLSQG